MDKLVSFLLITLTYIFYNFTNSDRSASSDTNLRLKMDSLIIRGNKILIGDDLVPATIKIENGKITEIEMGNRNGAYAGVSKVINGGDNVVMAGLVDSHVHVNEPGRTEWEGFYTATRAAAAGGITTIIDMPLNSIPPTITVQNLETKIESTKGKIHVDVGFWGGVVPDNLGELKNLVNRGVVGFKCFLIESGVDEFPAVTEEQVDRALNELKGTGSLLAFHAEMEVDNENLSNTDDKAAYETFLKSRPQKMESKAIEMLTRLCKKHNDVRCHIVHLSAADALPIITRVKNENFPLTVETCPHYLTLKAEEIQNRRTEYKCCPPIRDHENQDKLWDALKNGLIDMVVSDHSPCTIERKKPGVNDFMEAWGGISSVQFGLPIMWTSAQERGFKISDISKWMSQKTAKLAGVDKIKGKIQVGFDADFVIWDPNADIKIEEGIIQHKNKATPYKGKVLKGKVLTTILRGQVIYENQNFTQPMGNLLFPNAI